MWVQFPAPLNGLRIQHCSELWHMLWMWLRSGVAVAVASAGSCCSNQTPSLGTSICHGCGPTKKKKKKKKKTVRSASWDPGKPPTAPPPTVAWVDILAEVSLMCLNILPTRMCTCARQGHCMFAYVLCACSLFES